ncbi:MAG: ABC transporter substrate-binding protein [Chloroflexi bacterium]|nr:ABC transporter substrate-binding protein [Chloroflexota bacterium]
MNHHWNLSRRRLLLLTFGTTAASLLAACAPSAPSPSNPTAAPGTPLAPAQPAATQSTGSAQPKSGGTLRVVTNSDLSNLVPWSISPVSFDTMWTVFDPLTRYDAQLTPQPMLAESWDVTPDESQITLHLRKGVQFHTGRELTSDDVKWNIEHIKDPAAQATQLINMANWWSSIETPDKYTIVLKSDSPRPALFDMLEYLNIADPVTAQGPEASTKLVGTGPFMWGEWVQGDHQRYVKNPNYWQTGRPYVDELYVQVTRDAPAAAVQFESGAVDAMLNPPVRDLARLQSDPQYRAIINKATGQYFIAAFNTTQPPFDNKQVRQAYNYAINRQRFVDSVLIGDAEARDLPWAPQSPAFDTSKNTKYAYDPDKAKSLLAQAGNPPIDMDISYSSSDYEPGQLAQIMQADYTNLGATVNAKSMETAALQNLFNTVGYKGVSLRFSGFAGTDPATLFTIGAYYRVNTNASGFKSDRYQQLVNAAGSEADPAKRKQIFSDLNDLLLDESFVAIVSSQTVSVLAHAAMNGVMHSMHEAVIWTDAWKA